MESFFEKLFKRLLKYILEINKMYYSTKHVRKIFAGDTEIS